MESLRNILPGPHGAWLFTIPVGSFQVSIPLQFAVGISVARSAPVSNAELVADIVAGRFSARRHLEMLYRLAEFALIDQGLAELILRVSILRPNGHYLSE